MSNPHTADLEARARYREEGRQLEQERIIKQLQKEIDFMYSGVGLVEHHHQTISFLEGFIELIKGETK